MRRAAAIVLLATTWSSDADTVGRRPFTVADSIAARRLVDPDIDFIRMKSVQFNRSPDGRKFIIVTRKGDLESGANHYSLSLFHTSDVLDFVNKIERVAPLAEDRLLAFSTTLPKHAITGVTWLPDTKGIALIARENDGPAQVYAFDLASRQLSQLTHHSHDVVSFDYLPQHGKLVYAAYTMPDWSKRNRHGYAVTSEQEGFLSMQDPAEADPMDIADIKYFSANLQTGQSTEIRIPRTVLPRPISIAPSGKWAVVAITAQGWPAHWNEYAPLAEGQRKPSGTDYTEDNDAFGRPTSLINEYQLIDLATNTAKRLIDAPAYLGFTPNKAIWSPDGERVLLPSTFLPLTDKDLRHREHRRRNQATAEIDVATGRATQVADIRLGSKGAEPAPLLSQVSWIGDAGVEAKYGTGVGAAAITRRYQRRGDAWISSSMSGAGQLNATDRLELRVHQDMNTPPDIVAIDRTTPKQRRITQLNPQFSALTFGRVETFAWTDRLGRRLLGGLLVPPDFVSGRRYPVVFQTYGFDPHEFLMDGPISITTAYAAQALASKQLLVFQLPDLDGGHVGNPDSYDEYSENRRFLAGLEAAIDALDTRGLIDRNRVGLIGFSREGMHVHHAITFSTYPFAAATVADSIVATPLSYTLLYGAPYPGMAEFEEKRLTGIGAPFWGEGIQLWLQRSDIFHLHRIRTPVRYERLGTGGATSFWDVFAILKRQRRPVELIHIPFASHNIQQPWARYTSQQGNVDWFAFWLRDEQDPDPAKAEQYIRWRKLRAQRDLLSTEPDSRSVD